MSNTKTPDTAERQHHSYSPSSLQMREACPLWAGTGESNVAAERGTAQHKFTEDGVDDNVLDDWEFSAAAECIDYAHNLKQKFIDEGYEVEEIIEAFLPIDDRHWTVSVYDTKLLRSKKVKETSTTAGYVDRIMLVRDIEHAEVMDWKFGAWEVEHARDNVQGIAYVLGAFRRWPWIQTVRLSFKQPKLDLVTDHVFSRADIPELTLRVVTIVERAAACAKRVSYKHANVCVPACLFCARRGSCKPVQDIILKVGRKYYPVGIPDNITAETLDDPKQVEVGLRLCQIVTAWATGYKQQKTQQVIMGDAPVPDGFELSTYSKRRIEDPIKFEQAALKFLTPEELRASFTPTLGAAEQAVSDKAPRGSKTSAVKEFKQHLEDEKAVVHTTPAPYLKALSKKKSESSGSGK